MSSLRRLLAGLFIFGIICAGSPSLTPVRDVLYRADGTPLTGVVVITWPAFTAVDGTVIAANTMNVEVRNGKFRVDLVPTTNAQNAVAYTVRIISDGKDQTQETWSVPPSAAPLTISSVLVNSSPGVTPPPGLSTGVSIGDVQGLSNELAARPLTGPGYAASRAAVIDANGALAAASGDPGDCVRVNGTSGPCGSSGAGSSATFMDAEIPAGIVDGANVRFSLSKSPNPRSSLMLARNGLVLQQGTDYSVSGNTVSFQAATAPQAGDLLQASYRAGNATSGSSTITGIFSDTDNAFGPYSQDFSASNAFIIRSLAGAAPTAAASVAYDQTSKSLKYGNGSSTKTIANLEDSQTYTGPKTFGSLNAMINPAACSTSNPPSWCSGTTADQWIVASCGQLPPTGGVVDLRGFGATQSNGQPWVIANQVRCSTPTKQVEFLVGPATRWTITENDGNIVFPLDNGSGIKGEHGQTLAGLGGAGGVFQLATTANVKAIVGPAHEDFTQESYFIEGITLMGNTGATVGKGLIYAYGLGTPTRINYNNAQWCNNACAWIENSGGTSTMVGNWFNAAGGNSSINGSALVVRASNGTSPRTSDWLITGNNFEHGNGKTVYTGTTTACCYNVDISGDDSGAQVGWITFTRNYMEQPSTAGAVPPTVSVRLRDCVHCVFRDIKGNIGTGDFINVSQSGSNRTQNVDMYDIYDGAGGAVNVINDQVDSPSVQITSASHPFVSRYTVNGGYDYTPAMQQTTKSIAASSSVSAQFFTAAAGNSAFYNAPTGQQVCFGVGSTSCAMFINSSNILTSTNQIIAPVFAGSSGSLSLRPGVDSSTAVRIQNAAGGATVLNMDTTNSRIGIGTSAPAYALQVAGDTGVNNLIHLLGNTSAFDVLDTHPTTYGTLSLAGASYPFNGTGHLVLQPRAAGVARDVVFAAGLPTVAAVSFTGTGLNDATSGGSYNGASSPTYCAQIDGTSTPDTFKWGTDNCSTFPTTGVAITGAAQTLSNGVTITFAATTGHTLADQWAFAATPLKMPLIVAGTNRVGVGGVTTPGQALDVNGNIAVRGSTSGIVTLQPQAAAGTYNWNLPTSAGTSGQPLLSGGGGSTAMSFGTLSPFGGGTGASNPTAHSLAIAEGASNFSFLNCGTNTVLLGQGASADPTCGTLGVAAGGTGMTSGTSGGVLYFSGTGTLASSGLYTANVLLKGGGSGAAPGLSSITDNGTTVSTTENVTVNAPQSGGRNANLTATNGFNSLLFGHQNTGFLSALGAFSAGGQPFICFYCYHSAMAGALARSSGTNVPVYLGVDTSGNLTYNAGTAGTVDTTFTPFSLLTIGTGTSTFYDAQTSTVGAAMFAGAGLNDTTSGGTYTGTSNPTYCVQIDAIGTPDTFKWGTDNCSTFPTTGVAITGGAQTLNNGVIVSFGASTGHTLNDKWTIATTAGGSTLVSIRAGIGQSGNLQEWRNNGNTVVASLSSGAALTLGASGTLGSLTLKGNTSGAVTLQTQPAAGTYNFNLPTSAGSSGQPLLSAGGASSPMTFGTLGVAAGGTGLTGGTSGGILYFSGASSVASTAALNAHGVLLGEGAGNSPVALPAGGTNTVLLGQGATADPVFGPVPNAALANSSVTINGTPNQIVVTGGGPLALGATATLSLPSQVSLTSVSTAVNTVAFSTTPTFNAALGNVQMITLIDNVTTSSISNSLAGTELTMLICQDATGGHIFTWPSNVHGAMAIGGSPTLCSAQKFIYNGSAWYALSAGLINQ